MTEPAVMLGHSILSWIMTTEVVAPALICHALQIGLGAAALPRVRGRLGYSALGLALVAGVVQFAAWGLLVLTELLPAAAPAWIPLVSTPVELWFYMLIFFSFPASILSVVIDLRPRKHTLSFAARLLGVAATAVPLAAMFRPM